MATPSKKPTARTTKTTTKTKATSAHTKAAAKKPKAVQMRSFRPCNDPAAFMSTSPSIQSFYWVIIGVVILILVAWTMHLTIQIQSIYDSIELSDTTSMIMIK